MKFEHKTMKPTFHSAKHNSELAGHHEADLRKDDNSKEEIMSFTLNTGQEHPNFLRYFSTSKDPLSVPETIFRSKTTTILSFNY